MLPEASSSLRQARVISHIAAAAAAAAGATMAFSFLQSRVTSMRSSYKYALRIVVMSVRQSVRLSAYLVHAPNSRREALVSPKLTSMLPCQDKLTHSGRSRILE